MAGRQSIYYTFHGTEAGKQTSFWKFYSKEDRGLAGTLSMTFYRAGAD